MIRRLKGKKGFTLIEIIAVVVIIALLAGISIPVVSKYLSEGKNRYNKELVNEFSTIVKNYYAENPEKLPRGTNGKYSDTVYLTELQAKNYLSQELVDADGGSCHGSVGFVDFDGEKLNYYSCLRCDNYSNEESNGEVCTRLDISDICANDKEVKPEFSVVKKYYLEDEEEVDYKGNWINNNVIVRIKSDNFGYIKFNDVVYTKLDNYSEHYYDILLEDKTEKLNFIFYDKCGRSNAYEIDDIDVLIDKTAPSIIEENEKNEYVIEYDNPYNNIEITSNLMVKDSESIIDTIKYKYDGEKAFVVVYKRDDDNFNEKELKIAKTFQAGSYSLKVVATDIAGNVSIFEKEIFVYNEIKLISNGVDVAKIKKAAGETIDLNKISVTNTGYYLNGWKDKNNSKYVDIYYADLSTTLIAEWLPVNTDKYVKVKFYCSKNSNTYTLKTIYLGNKFISCGSKTGYNQSGWAFSTDTSKRYNVNATAQEDWIDNYNGRTLEVYAYWIPKTVKVTFYCSSSDKKTQTFTYGKSGQKFTQTCSKTGYNQSGWSLTSGGAKDYNVASNVLDSWIDSRLSSSITLYPVWTAKTVKVTFYCSSSDKKTQTFTYGKSGQQFSKKCSKTGLVLKGWATSNNGNKVYSVSANVIDGFIDKKSPSITLYPVWHFVPPADSSTCANDKVKPVCELLTSCYSVSGGVRAKFRCKDTSSKVTIYSVFAETGWQEDRFSSLSLIKSNMTSKGTGSAGSWVTKDTTWSTSTTHGNPPIKGKKYTFYFGAIDGCGNAIVIDNVTSACMY